MGKFYYDKTLKKELTFVLERDGIPYTFSGNKVYARLSLHRFRMAQKDAMCEKQRGASRIPVYSIETVMDDAKFERLCTLNKTRGFHILRGDLYKLQR